MAEYSASTPIDTFENTATGSLIDVVSMVHVGLPSYYRRLGGYITSRQEEGFQVQYEGIGESGDFVPHGVLEKAKYKLYQLKTDVTLDALVMLEIGSGYTNQDNDELFGEEVDRSRHDITEADQITGMSVLAHTGALLASRKMSRKLLKIAKRGEPEKLDEHIFGIIHRELESFNDGSKRPRSWGYKLLIGKRNEVALSGVDEALEADASAKLVLVWGLGHLAGLSSGLVDRGYEQTARQEVEAAFSRTILERGLEAQSEERAKLQAKITKQKKGMRDGHIWFR